MRTATHCLLKASVGEGGGQPDDNVSQVMDCCGNGCRVRAADRDLVAAVRLQLDQDGVFGFDSYVVRRPRAMRTMLRKIDDIGHVTPTMRAVSTRWLWGY